MIWEEFVRTPRIIHVDLRAIDPGAYPGYAVKIQLKDRIPFWCASTQVRQVCPILGVNRESRHIAMKEPLVIFALIIPMAHPEIFNDASVTHQFAMRRHDFLFIKGCESWRLGQIWNSGTTSQIANVIIDIDVHNINYQSAGRIPRWIALMRKGARITDLLKNKECLENFYCLMQDTTANGEQHLELDDLCELTVDRFPEHMHDLTTWLADFRKFPVNDSWGLIPFHDDDIKLYNKWKNITVRERE
ncbi:hypothetical protein F4825DRAFT_477760 [Nemania diffusa]|nr:hypothetical protein F4825DRAFT_477760 [Nemania diffusa]